MDNIFHGTEYTTLLTDIEFRSQLLAYVFHQFIKFAATSCVPVIVIDSPSFDSVKVVHDRSICNLNRNEHGEADYAIWYHVTKSSVSKTLVLSKDTDTWVYGLALMEFGIICDKLVFVKHGTSVKYSNLNDCVSSLTRIPSLAQIKYPVTSIVALYILTGCDYVSSFFRLSKSFFLELFVENAYICVWNI